VKPNAPPPLRLRRVPRSPVWPSTRRECRDLFAPRAPSPYQRHHVVRWRIDNIIYQRSQRAEGMGLLLAILMPVINFLDAADGMAKDALGNLTRDTGPTHK